MASVVVKCEDTALGLRAAVEIDGEVMYRIRVSEGRDVIEFAKWANQVYGRRVDIDKSAERFFTTSR
jgi:hypothetical protein